MCCCWCRTEDGPVSEHHPEVRMADLKEMMDLLRQKPSPTQKRLVPMATTGPSLVGVSMRQTRVTGPDVETIDRTVRDLPCHIYIDYSVCVCVCVCVCVLFFVCVPGLTGLL